MKSMRTPSLLAASMAIVAIVAMSLGGFASSASAQSAIAGSTLTPTVINVDDASQSEIPNAMRGQYRWGGYAAKPDGWPSTD